MQGSATPRGPREPTRARPALSLRARSSQAPSSPGEQARYPEEPAPVGLRRILPLLLERERTGGSQVEEARRWAPAAPGGAEVFERERTGGSPGPEETRCSRYPPPTAAGGGGGGPPQNGYAYTSASREAGESPAASAKLSERLGGVELSLEGIRGDMSKNLGVLKAENFAMKNILTHLDAKMDLFMAAVPKSAAPAESMQAKMDMLIASVQQSTSSVAETRGPGTPRRQPPAGDDGNMAYERLLNKGWQRAVSGSDNELDFGAPIGKTLNTQDYAVMNTELRAELRALSGRLDELSASPSRAAHGASAHPGAERKVHFPALDLDPGPSAKAADSSRRSASPSAQAAAPDHRARFREMYKTHELEEGGEEHEWKENIDNRLSQLRGEERQYDMIERVGHSLFFKVFSTLIIVVAVALMAVQTELQVDEFLGVKLCMEGKGPAPKANSMTAFFERIEWAMLGWMVVELLINVYIAGGLFCVEDASWNIFDLAIISASLIQKYFSGINLSGLRVIRIGRIMKFVRIFKVMKAFRIMTVTHLLTGVRKMLLCLVGSLASLFWAVILIFSFLFITALMMMQGIEVYYDVSLDAQPIGPCEPGGPGNGLWDGKPLRNEIFPRFMTDPENDTHTEQVKKLYGGVLRTIMALFSTISGGSEWQVVMDPVIRIHEGFYIFWIVFICVTLYGVLNVFTGLFCEAAVAAAANDTQTIISKELEETSKFQTTLRNAYMKVDEQYGGSGSLSEAELSQLLADPNVIATLSHMGIHHNESKGLFKLLDGDRSGGLSQEEWVDGCISLKGGARKVDVVQLLTQSRRLAKSVNSLMEMCDHMWVDMEKLVGSKHHPSVVEAGRDSGDPTRYSS